MRSFIIYLNFVSLLAVCLFACNHHSSNPMLQQVDSLLEMKPDSALTILKNISVLEDLPEVDKAYYALLLAEATDKNKLPLLPCDSLLNFVLDYYGDDDREKAVALMYKGRLLAEMDDEKATIEMNLKALEILQDYPVDTKYRRLIYSALGLWYGNCGLNDKALEVLHQSLHYSFDAKDTAIAYINIGYIYGMRNMQDSVITYQRKAVKYAMRSKDRSMILTSWHNLSICYRHFENVDSAVVYAHKVLQHLSYGNGKADAYYNMGDLYVDLEQYDSARHYLEKSLFLSPSRSIPYWSLAVMEAELGNFKSAYHYLDTFVMVQDSLDNSEQLTEVQHLVYKHQTELRVKDEQIKSKRIIRWIVFVSVIICFVVALIYQRWINKKNNQQALYRQALQYADEKQNVMQQRIEENESALALLQDRENQNLDEIAQKEQLITQLKKEKLALRTWLFQQTSIYKKVMSLSDQQQVNKKIRKVMAAAELDKLKKTTFEIYADYISPLQAQYSQLTEDDLLVLCLQEAGISPLAISLCFGHTDTVALNQRKSRLKKKMSE
ncbi:tetratricopeptide repeat protein [Phocaeicola vulgatus]|uniref:tetratricopeptide repeat protein n=1 Tax=Phocaeicola vulgatus TaxID=821 RepID=UPI0018A982EB|nr:tetratricopeptide repeat protein [Phocaeicola vulgatus]MDB0990212.1 tetratricopeptide repeat protein [Phocaeicola vulgatus]MDB1012192.1 tetratricopeptide repeat protein [Phocaeicola vulgatus]MDB1016655.1 tetratricopeptide repeat protein [Phocaeicola vulgatus]MDB1024998.1 tetratricopeptide repeat protein [Phocaeicola vulgatus]MDC1623304.1 tetratricopeptide repeat protein [Phocaeicola vulgatus]